VLCGRVLHLDVFVLLISLALPAPEPNGSDSRPRDPYSLRMTNTCGPACVLASLQMFAAEPPSRDFVAGLIQVANAKEDGMSMGEIVLKIREGGVSAGIVQPQSFAALLRSGHPFIAHRKGHFSFCVPAQDAKSVAALDYPEPGIRKLNVNDLDADYSEHVIILGDDALHALSEGSTRNRLVASGAILIGLLLFAFSCLFGRRANKGADCTRSGLRGRSV